ncbi:MAG: Rpn family recombination-promoting nuclease/putative transposase, partial [Peptostreptococcaceae bacterium]|nr:Rpn family recombination-promoting nuclease/putative transposase [Peptostreptococcaceae bacterium]
MQPVSGHHDHYFKANLGQAEMAADFLRQCLPQSLAEQVDFSSLQLQNGSFIEKELRQLYSDLLYRALIREREAYIYFLFEHKSGNDKNIALQLLGYLLSIYRESQKNHPSAPLPLVLPIVFYHGKTPWKAGRYFSDLLMSYEGLQEELKSYIPDFTYLLYDTNAYRKEELPGEIPLQIFLRIMKSILAGDQREFYTTLSETIRLLEALQDESRRMEIFEQMIRYIFSAREDADLEEIKKQVAEISYERSEELMSIAEKLEQRGLEKGMKLGKEQGIKLGIIEGKKQGIE